MPVQCVHTHTLANTDSTHRNFQTQTDKHTDTYIHIYKYTLRHTQNTYNILCKAFNTHEVLESHSLVMPSAKMSDILQQDDKMRMLGWSMMSTCPDGWNGQKRGWERLKLSLRRG